MTDRIDQYWGGALEWTALTPEERAAVDSVERAIHEMRAFVDAQTRRWDGRFRGRVGGELMHTPDDRHQSGSLSDDATIIARALDGDRQQFAQLVDRYQAALYRHAVSMVLDHDVAADIVQDAFVSAYTKLGTCRDRTRFRAWLFQTLRNRCLDHVKDARRKHVPLDDAGPIADTAERPDAPVERARLREEIRQALATLPEAQREAFMMRYVEGVPYDTMAELLHASVSTLKMRVLRAREALASALQNGDVTDAFPGRLSIISISGGRHVETVRRKHEKHDGSRRAGARGVGRWSGAGAGAAAAGSNQYGD